MNFQDLYKLNLAFVNVGGYIKYIARIFRLPKILKLLCNNKELITNRKYDTCYICGLGPSLADVNLDKLANMPVDTIVVNRFTKMAEITKLQPTHYIMVDNAFAIPPTREVLDEAVKLYPNTNFIWNTNFPDLDKGIMNLPCKKYFLAMYKGYYNKPKRIDITKVLPAFGNCVCSAIGFAIGVGYKKIVLLGCDFNSFASQHQVHCYDGGANGKTPRLYALDRELYAYAFDATVHLRLGDYAKEQGIEIINATRGSLIDAYERVDIPELYKE